jgi:hypothetical protein
VFAFGVLSGVAATAALLRLLPALADEDSGVEAAKALWMRGRRDGLRDLVRRWKASAVRRQEDRFAFRVGADDIARALAEAEDPEAVTALAEGLEQRDVGMRLTVVTGFLPWRSHPLLDELRPKRPVAPAVEAAIEALLVARLEDGERAEGTRWGDEPIGAEPIIGEISAYALAQRYPDRWSFDPKAPAAEREVARIALANGVRAKQSKPPLPTPERRAAPTPIPRAAVQADLDRLASADAAERAAALSRLFSKGVALVPALREQLIALPAEARGQKELFEALAHDLSFEITEVVEAKDALPLPTTVADALRKAKGQTYTARLFYDLWSTFAASEPAAGTMLVVHAERERAEVGVRLTVAIRRFEAQSPVAGFDGHHPWIRRTEGRDDPDAKWYAPSVATSPGAFDRRVEEYQGRIAATPLAEPFESEGLLKRQP